MDDSRPGLARRPALVLLAVASAATVAVAWWLVPWDWLPGGRLRPMAVDDLFTPAEVARAETYAGRRRLLGWAAYGLSLVVAAVLGLTPLGARLLRRAFGGLRWWLAVVLGVGAVLLAGRLATFPLAVLSRRQRLAYGLTEQQVLPWLRDLATSFLLGWVAAALLLVALVGLARRWRRRWYVGAGAIAVGLVAAGSYLYPVVVEPLFNDFTPLPAGELRAEVLELADREGVRVDEVLVADQSRRTTTLNAYVSGFGGTRRVVVYDTLVESLPTDEAAVIVAHELAHAKYDDVLLGTVLGGLGSLVGVALLALLLDGRRLRRRAGIHGPSDPAAVALVLALGSLGSVAAEPMANTVSRAIEIRADRDSLAATSADAAFVAMQRQLALRSLNDPTPPAWSQWWFGSHPTVLERAGLPASLQRAAERSPDAAAQ